MSEWISGQTDAQFNVVTWSMQTGCILSRLTNKCVFLSAFLLNSLLSDGYPIDPTPIRFQILVKSCSILCRTMLMGKDTCCAQECYFKHCGFTLPAIFSTCSTYITPEWDDLMSNINREIWQRTLAILLPFLLVRFTGASRMRKFVETSLALASISRTLPKFLCRGMVLMVTKLWLFFLFFFTDVPYCLFLDMILILLYASVGTHHRSDTDIFKGSKTFCLCMMHVMLAKNKISLWAPAYRDKQMLPQHFMSSSVKRLVVGFMCRYCLHPPWLVEAVIKKSCLVGGTWPWDNWGKIKIIIIKKNWLTISAQIRSQKFRL